MRFRNLRGNLLSSALVLLTLASAHADPVGCETQKFRVLRGDSEIGTNTISITRNGSDTTVQIATHVSVGLAFITLYKFDQTENEQWTNGQLQALTATTDDNGKLHKVSASNQQGQIVIEGDGQVRKAISGTLPISFWNPPSLEQNVAFNPEDGSVMPVSVVDRGEDSVVVCGRAVRAHHYFVKSAYAQDVWYDNENRLVKMEMRVLDGSTIRYELI